MTARSALALLAFTALLLGAPALPAQAAPGAAPLTSSASDRAALRFWSPARMERARALSVQIAGGAHLARSAAISGSPPAGRLPETPHRYPPRARAAASAPDRPARASTTFQTVAEAALPGNSQNGAVFIVLGHGEGFARCSGTSVNAPNLSVVITAGHCVNSGGPDGEWYDHKWVFVPGYHNGERPFGVFAARWIGSTPRGSTLLMRTTTSAPPSSRATNAASVSAPPPVPTASPGACPLASSSTSTAIRWRLPLTAPPGRLCSQTPYEGHDVASFFWPGPLNLAVQCNVTGGASGGGWTIAGGLLNGITTYGYPSDPATDFGPYFGRAIARLYSRAARVR